MDRERRLERLGLERERERERGREVGRGRGEQDRSLPEREPGPEQAWPDRESPVSVGLDKPRPNRAHALHQHQDRRSSAGSEEPESTCPVREQLKKDKAERDKAENEPDKHSNAAKGGPVPIKKPTAKKTK